MKNSAGMTVAFPENRIATFCLMGFYFTSELSLEIMRFCFSSCSYRFQPCLQNIDDAGHSCRARAIFRLKVKIVNVTGTSQAERDK